MLPTLSHIETLPQIEFGKSMLSFRRHEFESHGYHHVTVSTTVSQSMGWVEPRVALV